MGPCASLPHRSLLLASVMTAALGCSGTPATPVEPGVEAEGTRPPDAEPLVEDRPSLADYGLEHVGVNLPGEEICEKDDTGALKNPIAPGTYQGLLRNARCEQQKFITMARVAKALGVQCDHCHVKDPDDPKKELYPELTENKRIANWMYKTFIQGLRPRDGSEMMCATCHQATESGEAKAKILGDPRDENYAQEWMHEVMTTEFVEANGKRLRCKTCHLGLAPDTEGWIEDVIRRLRYKGKVERRDDVANDAGE